LRAFFSSRLKVIKYFIALVFPKVHIHFIIIKIIILWGSIVKKTFKTILRVIGVLFMSSFLWFIGGVFWPLEVPTPKKPIPKLLLTNLSLVDVEEGFG
jgi:hypothetical protein